MAKNQNVGRVVVYPASGGLETIAIPGMQTVGRLVEGFGFMVDINGSKKKQPGAVRQDNGASIPTVGNTRGLFDFWRLNGTQKTQRTVIVTNGKILADNGNGVYQDVTNSFSINPLSNISIETFFGLMIMGFTENPNNKPLKFDGTTVDNLGGTPPNVRYLRQWQDRLWGAGNPNAPDRLYGSSVDDPENWDIVIGTALQINIDQGDQDPVGITSIFPPMYNRMIIGKKRSLYEVFITTTTDPSTGFPLATFGVRALISGLGSVSHNAVTAVDDDVYFVSERGIHSLMMTNKLGQIETGFLSYPIQNFFQENINFKRADNMHSAYAPEINSYFLAATSKGASRNDILLGYNFVLKEWYLWHENISAMAQYVDHNDGNKTKIIVADDNGRVGILDTTTTGRAVTWFNERRQTQFTTGVIFPINVVTEVNFSKLTVFCKPQTPGSKITVSYKVNGKFVEDLVFSMAPSTTGSQIGSAIIGVDKIGSNGVIKQVTRQMKGVGHNVELVFTHDPSTDDEDFELYGFVIEYEYAGETELPKTQ